MPRHSNDEEKGAISVILIIIRLNDISHDLLQPFQVCSLNGDNLFLPREMMALRCLPPPLGQGVVLIWHSGRIFTAMMAGYTISVNHRDWIAKGMSVALLPVTGFFVHHPWKHHMDIEAGGPMTNLCKVDMRNGTE